VVEGAGEEVELPRLREPLLLGSYQMPKMR